MGRKVSFGERLIQLIDSKGIKKADIARMANIDRASITHYINGDYEAKQDAVYRIALAFNVSETWLMGYDVPMERPEAILDSVIRSIPFICCMIDCCDVCGKDDHSIVGHYFESDYNGCLLYLIRYSSLKHNDCLFYQNFFGTSNLDSFLQDTIGKSITDCLSNYSRDEINFIRKYRNASHILRVAALEVLGSQNATAYAAHPDTSKK